MKFQITIYQSINSEGVYRKGWVGIDNFILALFIDKTSDSCGYKTPNSTENS